MKRLLVASDLAPLGSVQDATVYLCKAYNDSTFWAQAAHCDQLSALNELRRWPTGSLGINKFSKLRTAKVHVPG